ncbi:MAG: cytochrome c [Myxococcales bacterium]|nr:cytochrome c [Myxococcales bacterium]
MRRILIAAALLAFAPGCESGSDNPDVATIVALSGDATSGESLYGTHCSSCHMADGTGNPGLNYPSLVEHASKETDEEIVAIVLEGEEAMPAFRSQLSDQEVADVLAYIRATWG